MSSYLNDQNSWHFEIDEKEPKNVRFYYPSLFDPDDAPYIRKSVLIEFGIRGAIYPFEVKDIRSYVETDSSEILEIQDIKIRTLAPERTFWEKITLIHAENHRPEDKNMGDRTSRHYYDVFKLLQSDVKQLALSNLELLKDVIINKSKYFRSSWAHYDTAIPGSLNIVPNPTLKFNLARDYENMKLMIYGNIPEFDLILNEIEMFQNDFNKLKWG